MSRFRSRKEDLVGFEKSIMLAIWTVPRWDVNSLRRKAKTHKNSIAIQIYIPGFLIQLDLESDFCFHEIAVGNIGRPPRERM